jgi:hypothetical protein
LRPEPEKAVPVLGQRGGQVGGNVVGNPYPLKSDETEPRGVGGPFETTPRGRGGEHENGGERDH